MLYKAKTVAVFCLMFTLSIALFGYGAQDAETLPEPTATTAPAMNTPMPAVEPTVAPEAETEAETEMETDADSETAAVAEEIDTEETGTEEGNGGDSESASEAVTTDATPVWTTIEQAESIQSYRMRVTIVVTKPEEASKQSVSLEGAFVKEPPAEEILVEMDEGSGELLYSPSLLR